MPKWQLTISNSLDASFQKLRRRQLDVPVRHAVESVAAHRLLLVVFIRQAIQIGVRRQRLVEGRVESGHVGHQGKHAALPDALDIDRIVQRCQRVQCFQLLQYFVGDNYRFHKPFATMHHPMANGADLGRVA